MFLPIIHLVKLLSLSLKEIFVLKVHSGVGLTSIFHILPYCFSFLSNVGTCFFRVISFCFCFCRRLRIFRSCKQLQAIFSFSFSSFSVFLLFLFFSFSFFSFSFFLSPFYFCACPKCVFFSENEKSYKLESLFETLPPMSLK
jgi:hypothetical protein